MKHVIYVDAAVKLERSYIAWFNETTNEKYYNKRNCETIHICEYKAIIHALQNAKQIHVGDEVEIRCDREPVVKQLELRGGINDAKTRKLANSIWKIDEKLGGKKLTYVWISRSDNKAGKILGS